MRYSLDNNIVMALVATVKSRYFGENYVSFEELKVIKKMLHKKLDGLNIELKFIGEINPNVFKMIETGYISTDGFYLNEEMYFKSILDEDIRDVLWNEAYVYKCLSATFKLKLEGIDLSYLESYLSVFPRDLSKIIENVVENSSVLYEEIANNLLSGEKRFLKSLIEDKNCRNCDNMSCRVENYEKIGNAGERCLGWNNNVLIGRQKVISRNLF